MPWWFQKVDESFLRKQQKKEKKRFLADSPEWRHVVHGADDLDRCLPDNVVVLIEAIKLFLCASENPLTSSERAAGSDTRCC